MAPTAAAFVSTKLTTPSLPLPPPPPPSSTSSSSSSFSCTAASTTTNANNKLCFLRSRSNPNSASLKLLFPPHSPLLLLPPSRRPSAFVLNVLKPALESSHLSLSATTPLPDSILPPPKPTILVSEKLGDAGLQLLRTFADVDCSYDLSPEDLCAKISLCDALIVRSGTKVTRHVFQAANGRLKVVGRAGVGIDNVDLQAATEFGCLVVNAPTANTIAAAEHAIALLASMARNVAQADASMKAGKWQRNN